MDVTDEQERLKRTLGLMNDALPHGRALGFRLTDVGPSTATLSADWREDLIGDGEIIAGGLVTALLDQVCGLAVQAALPAFSPIATLDLRIDYMRAARPRAGIVARADCFRRTRQIAFVRAIAHDGDPDDPVAAAQAAFMLETVMGGIR
jgi:uncharacterized protein (TIGR00369 family)